MKLRIQTPLFLSTFLTPIPYLGLASVLGLRDFFRIVFTKGRFLHLLVGNCLFLISLVLLANLARDVALSYEEMKRLAVIACSLTTGLYFISRVSLHEYSHLQKNQVILFLSFGWLVSSLVFWELPLTAQYANYSWYKFAGASALILCLLQVYAISKLRNSVTIWVLLGISLTTISIFNGAKSFALLTLILMFLRVGLGTALKVKNGSYVNFVSRRFRLVRTILVTAVTISIIVFLARGGWLGTRLEILSGQYGSNFAESFFRARPEFTYSTQILKDLPFLGYGTVSDPFNHINIQLVTSSSLTFQEQHFLLNRILVDGFNLHSWTFDLVVRAGFLCFIPILWYAFLLIRTIFSFELISNYPGLTFICIVCLEDLFFSPYSWFVSIQIAMSFLAIYLSHQFLIAEREMRSSVKV
jgi:hypothetical protein